MSYQLVSYGGQLLPTAFRYIYEDPIQPGGRTVACTDNLTSMLVRLETNGNYSDREARLLRCDDGRPDLPSNFSMQGTYETSGDTIVLVAQLDQDTHYVSVGHFTDSSLTISRRSTYSYQGTSSTDPTPLVFRRAP